MSLIRRKLRSKRVPEGFDWDLWLGGCAARPFVGDKYYHPEIWRKRLDFGTGTFGDMGCHIFDPVFEALALGAPLSVRSEGPPPDAWNWANHARIHYVFPGTRFTEGDTVPVSWYDGTQRPPEEIQALVLADDPNQRVSDDGKRSAGVPEQGSILVGTEGTMLIPHVAARIKARIGGNSVLVTTTTNSTKARSSGPTSANSRDFLGMSRARILGTRDTCRYRKTRGCLATLDHVAHGF
jgi:predicted dehydrogenase